MIVLIVVVFWKASGRIRGVSAQRVSELFPSHFTDSGNGLPDLDPSSVSSPRHHLHSHFRSRDYNDSVSFDFGGDYQNWTDTAALMVFFLFSSPVFSFVFFSSFPPFVSRLISSRCVAALKLQVLVGHTGEKTE